MKRRLKFIVLGLLLVELIVTAVWLMIRNTETSDDRAALEKSETELAREDSVTGLAIEEGYISIYYVEGDQIKCEEQYMPFRGSDVFEAWKQKNGLGHEVELISSRIEDNGEESTYEFQGQSVVTYKVGDYFIYNIVISKEIESYFDTIDQELLFSSWEQTIRGYSMIEYDEFNIIIE